MLPPISVPSGASVWPDYSRNIQKIVNMTTHLGPPAKSQLSGAFYSAYQKQPTGGLHERGGSAKMGIKARRGLLLLAIISVVGALLLSVGVTSPKKAEADYCGWAVCPPPPPPVTISIPDSGAASPYPSEINVQGLSGTITDVNVTLNGYRHGFPDDVAVQVVSPTGKSVLLMSDVGGHYPIVTAAISSMASTSPWTMRRRTPFPTPRS